MSDPTSKAQQALDRLTEKLVEDVFLASDAEILAEATEEGRDVADEAARSRAIFARAVAAQGKRKSVTGRSTGARRESLVATIRRSEQGLSDADVYGILDDLADLGLLPSPDDTGST